VGAELVKGLQDRRWARVVVLDLVVNRSWNEWQAACASAGISLPAEDAVRDIVRIDLDDWGGILQNREGDDLPAVRAAILCGALRGAENARRNQIAPAQTQKDARDGIIQLVQDRLPSAERFTYLPSDEERALLDLPLWGQGAVDLSMLRDQLGRPQFS